MPINFSEPFGVLDGGSNSFAFVIFNGLCRWPVSIRDPIKAQCGLGEGTSENNLLLNPGGKAKSLRLLRQAAAVIEEVVASRGGQKFSIEGFFTAAVRNATRSYVRQVRLDAEQYIRDAEVAFGFRPPEQAWNSNFIRQRELKVMHSEEEGDRAAYGVMSGIPGASGLVIDIGGNSAELVQVHDRTIINRGALPVGTLTRINGGDLTFDQRTKLVDEKLSGISWLQDLRDQPLTIYLVGGAQRGFGRFCMHETNYPMDTLHGYVMTRAEMLYFAKAVQALTQKDWEKFDGSIRGRAKTIPPGAAVAFTLGKYFDQSEFDISAYGVRDGTVYNRLTPEERNQSPLPFAAKNYFHQHPIPETPKRLEAWTQRFLSGLSEINRPRDAIVETICLLTNCVPDVTLSRRAVAAFDKIMDYDFGDLSHKERVMMALALNIYYEGTKDQELGRLRNILPEGDDLFKMAIVVGSVLDMASRLGQGTAALLNQVSLDVADGKIALTIPDDFPIASRGHILRNLARIGKILDHETVVTKPENGFRSAGRIGPQAELSAATV